MNRLQRQLIIGAIGAAFLSTPAETTNRAAESSPSEFKGRTTKAEKKRARKAAQRAKLNLTPGATK